MHIDHPELKLCPANAKDIDRIVEFSRDIYEGRDYLAGVYHSWLADEDRHPDRRRNVVLMDANDRVIGFQSFLFQDKGRRVVCMALRIDHELRGQGIGRKFMAMCRDYLTMSRPELVECKTVWHGFLPTKKQFCKSMGTLLGKKLAHFYDVPCDGNKLLNALATAPSTTGETQEIPKKEVWKFMSKHRNFFCDTVLLGDYLLVTWIPYYLASPEDVSGLLPYGQEVRFVVDDATNPTSLSVLTLPFKCEAGYSIGLDVYATSPDHVSKHILNQLAFVVPLIRGKGLHKQTVILWMTCDVQFHQQVGRLFQKFSVSSRRGKDFPSTDNDLDCDEAARPRFLIYEKAVSSTS